jgi:hypothetical protein
LLSGGTRFRLRLRRVSIDGETHQSTDDAEQSPKIEIVGFKSQRRVQLSLRTANKIKILPRYNNVHRITGVDRSQTESQMLSDMALWMRESQPRSLVIPVIPTCLDESGCLRIRGVERCLDGWKSHCSGINRITGQQKIRRVYYYASDRLHRMKSKIKRVQ